MLDFGGPIVPICIINSPVLGEHSEDQSIHLSYQDLNFQQTNTRRFLVMTEDLYLRP